MTCFDISATACWTELKSLFVFLSKSTGALRVLKLLLLNGLGLQIPLLDCVSSPGDSVMPHNHQLLTSQAYGTIFKVGWHKGRSSSQEVPPPPQSLTFINSHRFRLCLAPRPRSWWHPEILIFFSGKMLPSIN